MTTDDMELLREYVQHDSETAFAELVARYVSANALTIQRRREQREQEAYMQSLHPENESEVWSHIAPMLDTALAALGEQEHNAIVLRFLENKNLKDVGAALGSGEEAARKRVNRGLEKLRRFFTKRGVISTTAIIAGAISANSIQAAPATLARNATSLAMAKGVVVSGSTLTLVQSTVKFMMWTKIKTVLVAGVVIMTLAVGAGYGLSEHTPPGKTMLTGGKVTPKIGFGHSHAIVLTADGSLWAWGEEDLGWPVLGLKSTRHTTALRRVGRDNDWADIAVGWPRNLAIKSDGTVWGWGAKLKLRQGAESNVMIPTVELPGKDWKQVAVGGTHYLALKKDGTLWGWGNNWAGQLGTGDLKERLAPEQVGTDNHWARIWAGEVQNVGLKADGSLWFWGSLTGSSKVPNSILVPKRISDETNWLDVCFGYFTEFAIRGDGTLWTWGRLAGDYSKTPDKSPSDMPVQIGTESDWQACACADGFYTLLLKRDGSLWAMDASDHRRVAADNIYKPVEFRRIELNKEVAAFAAGKDNIGLALTPQGEVWAWGNVLGEHTHADFQGANGTRTRPKYKIWEKPQQLIISDVME